jgi:hypothetical protein
MREDFRRPEVLARTDHAASISREPLALAVSADSGTRQPAR